MADQSRTEYWVTVARSEVTMSEGKRPDATPVEGQPIKRVLGPYKSKDEAERAAEKKRARTIPALVEVK